MRPVLRLVPSLDSTSDRQRQKLLQAKISQAKLQLKVYQEELEMLTRKLGDAPF